MLFNRCLMSHKLVWFGILKIGFAVKHEGFCSFKWIKDALIDFQLKYIILSIRFN